jgi:hypothetical protein
MKDLFIILESKDKKCTENVYLECLKDEMSKNRELNNIFNFSNDFKIYCMGNVTKIETFEKKLNSEAYIHDWYYGFEKVFLIYDNDSKELISSINNMKIKIEKYLRDSLFKEKKGNIFFMSPKKENHTFDKYLCLHFQNEILDKKKSENFLNIKLNSDK